MDPAATELFDFSENDDIEYDLSYLFNERSSYDDEAGFDECKHCFISSKYLNFLYKSDFKFY